jgi:broad specificity phosphatase PhoE
LKTTIYLIRHGKSIANELHMYHGHTDYALSETGHNQARDLATKLHGIKFDAIYSSPLIRAYDTIKPLAEKTGLKITADKRLMEIYAGAWEDIPFAQLQRDFPEQIEYIIRTEHHVGAEGIEHYDDMAKRMVSALTDIATAHPGGTVAVASHMQAMRAFICHVNNIPYPQIMQKIGDIPNATFKILEYDSKTKTFSIN